MGRQPDPARPANRRLRFLTASWLPCFLVVGGAALCFPAARLAVADASAGISGAAHRPTGAPPGQERARGQGASEREGSGSEGAPPTLDDARLDALTARVADQLRCPVCRNQSVLESSSELARRMQALIRERLAAGASPEEVKAYFVARYGEWILLQPTARGLNWAVYLLPAVVVLGGGILLRSRFRAWQATRRAVAPTGTAPVPSPEPQEPAASEADRAIGNLSERDEAWLDEAIRSG